MSTEEKKNDRIETAGKSASEKNISEKTTSEKKAPSGEGKIRKSFTSRVFRTGVYTTVISVIVIAIVIIVNLAFNKLDLKTDMSSNKVYTLSADTRKVAAKVKDPIVIYYMVTDGKEESKIENVLKNYSRLSPNIKVEKKDPVIYPKFGSSLGIDDDISNNDVIVYNKKNKSARYISNGEMLFEAYSSDQTMTGQTLDVEGKVTAAILYVLSSEHTKMYMLSDNGITLSDNIMTSVGKLNIDTDTLNLISSNYKVPDDCDILFIAGLTSDLTNAEYKAILKYLKAGGDAVIFSTYTTNSMDNFNKLLDYYGVSERNGIIIEGEGHYGNARTEIYPSISSSGILKDLKENSIEMYAADAIDIKDLEKMRSTLSVTPILTTSRDSFLMTDLTQNLTNKQMKKLSRENPGPFNVGVQISDQTDDSQTNIILYSSSYPISEQYESAGDNVELLTKALSSMTRSTVAEISIPVKNLAETQINVPTGMRITLAVILIVMLPSLLLIIGFIIWYYRRQR